MSNKPIDWICGCACCGDDVIGHYTMSKEEFIYELEEKEWVQRDGNWYCKYCAEKLGLKKHGGAE
jgi:hypothetical protein